MLSFIVTTLAPILMDIALGAMAYRLARSLEKTQAQQTLILEQLVKRVDALEDFTGRPGKPL